VNREKIIRIIDELIFEAQKAPTWKAENALRCLKKELLKEQEAKTGHWISVNDGDIVAIDNDGFPERACFCSECKKYLIASDEYAVYGRYCPFCGAKMESR
jgi:uncharacterized CHY-type Zn-finger protein